MILLDEIRGRFSEAFSLKKYNIGRIFFVIFIIDNVLYGGIASICTYGSLMGATAEEIEYAIGMFASHYVPYSAVRIGNQLTDSKGSAAAFSTEIAVKCM